MNKETLALINQFKKEAYYHGYDDIWVNKILREALSRDQNYLMSTILFNLQLLGGSDDR